MSRVMLTANEARAKSLQDIIVLREIRDIEEAILTATANGEMSAQVVGTVMTAEVGTPEAVALAAEYFDTWSLARDDRQKYLQMEKIIRYFSDLGYAIDRQVNSSGITFKWFVAW